MKSDQKLLSLFVGFILALLLIPTSNLAGASTPQLDTVSLSFPSPQRGYVLSLYECGAKTCAAMRSTQDAGSSWTVVPIPRQLNQSLTLAPWGTYDLAFATISVHFADAKDGWIYGTVPAPVTPTSASPNWVSRLWSTHDGGKTWSRIRLSRFSLTGGVVQMASHGAWTYLFGASFQNDHAYLFGTRSNTDKWTNKSDEAMGLPAGGSVLEGAFTFMGSSGWFTAGNDRGFTASARLLSDGSWSGWSGPSFKKFGASFTPIGAVTSRVLVAEGESAGYVYPPASTVPPDWNEGASWLFISYDAGATFKPFRQLSHANQGGYATVPGLPAIPKPGTILLERSSNSGGQNLEVSTDWGRSWRVVLGRVADVVFSGHTTAFAIVEGRSAPSTFSLFRTTTAGSSWSRVSVEIAPRYRDHSTN